MTSEELYERYHNKLPVFFVENYWKDGYVNLEQDDEWRENKLIGTNDYYKHKQYPINNKTKKKNLKSNLWA